MLHTEDTLPYLVQKASMFALLLSLLAFDVFLFGTAIYATPLSNSSNIYEEILETVLLKETLHFLLIN